MVTDSSRGVGAAIAQEFARQGAKVVLHGRDKTALAVVAEIIFQHNGKSMTVTGDVTKFQEIEAMRGEIENRFGPLDILIANAGGNYTPPAQLEEIPEDGWRATVDGNLTATFLTLKSFLPGMKQRRSGRPRTPHANAPIAYGAARAGIVMLTQDVAAQAGPYGIRVNCIAPETILTERNQDRIPQEQ